ncbi:uncharacterized protein [Epargyreus clarus]|uniref:uncharacterized protein isoform X3 n=1 Tax=Epargyreus clarus TaxID=520877 RepID=UPI003C2DBFED
MSEIFNLHTLCRCCHKDGKFRSLQLCYVYETELEMYATMLRETFNINMNMPTIDASNSICDDCIKRLRDAASFKRQVLDCEQKFQLYCKNEQALIIKEEITYDYDDDNNDKDSVEEGNLVVDESYNDDTQCKAEHPDESSVKDCKPEGNYYWEVKIEDEWEQTETVIQNPNNTEDREVKESVRKKMRKTIKDEVKESERKIKDTGTSDLNIGAAIKTDKHTAYKYQCDVCKKYYLCKSSLKCHIKKHFGMYKKYICDFCGHVFNNAAYMEMHMSSVHQERRPFKCTLCPKTFTANKHLTVHYRDHTGDRPYSCDVCSASFKSWCLLKRHKKSKHSDTVQVKKSLGRRYICKICAHDYKSRGKLQYHMRVHAEQEFKCDICVKTFSTGYTLKRHMAEHSGVKKYICEICNNAYTQKSHMERHKSVYHEPHWKPPDKVKCNLCHIYFKDIEKHMNAHNKRTFACERCNKSYPQRNTLNRHIKLVHEGAKEHPCTMCGKQYSLKKALDSHMLKVHNETERNRTETERGNVN